MVRTRINRAARFTAAAAFAAVIGVPVNRPVAAAPPTNLIGRIQSHSFSDGLGHNSQSTDASPTFHFTQSGSRGTIDGSLTLTFPENLPPANYDSTGTSLVFTQPWTATINVQISWTTPAARSTDDPKTVFDFELDRLEVYDEGHSISSPNCDASIPDQAELNENTTYTWNQSVSCKFSTLPVFSAAFSPTPQIVLAEQVDYTFAGDAASGFFIDGGVPSVRSTYLVAPPTLDLSIDHLEAIQTVQDINNSIALIADKPTVVRAFGKFTDSADELRSSVEGVPAVLHAFHGSTEIAGSPIHASNAGGRITVSAHIDRDATTGSWNFKLPSDWTDEGTLTFKAEVNADKSIGETDTTNNLSAPLSATFVPSPDLVIAYLPVCYLSAASCPSNAIARYDGMARKLYPIGDPEFLYKSLKTPQWIWPEPLPDEDALKRFLSFVLRRYALMDAQDGFVADQLLAWLPSIPGQSLVGLSDPVWLGSTGRVCLAQDTSELETAEPDLHDAAQTLAHEVGHNLGLRHTDIHKGQSGCGAVDPNSDFYRFYADHLATIHEVGFDTLHLAAISDLKKDLMSYCTPPGSDIWISPFDYNKLISGHLAPQARVRPFVNSPADYLIVSGSVASGGSSGQIDSIVRATTTTAGFVSDASGNTCLRLSSSGGTTLSKFCFELSFEGAETLSPLAREAFTQKVPVPTAAARVSLEFGASVLDAVSASPHAPAVAITAPHSGDSWSGVKTVTWTASDSDNDPLTFAVLTSPDNGKTWLPMQTDLTADQYTLDSAELSAGATTLVRVLASDGFNTTATTVGPFTVAAQAFVEATPELTFGAATAASPQTLGVMLTNRGTKDAHLNGYQSSNAAFGASAILPLAIPAGGSATLPVTFTPGTAGNFSALLTLATDDSARASLTVALVGTSGDDCRPIATIPCVLPANPPAPISVGRR